MRRSSGLEELGYQACPAGLVRRAHAATAVAVEVLVEECVVAEMRITRQLVVLVEDRPPATFVGQEDARQAPRQLVGNLVERAPLGTLLAEVAP